MLSLSDDNQSKVIAAFNYNSRYLDESLDTDYNFFDIAGNHIYPIELLFDKANVSDTEASFLDLHLSIGRWLVGCFWLNGPLRQYFSLYRAVSQRERKMSKQPPAPTASAVGPCPNLIQIVGRPSTGNTKIYDKLEWLSTDNLSSPLFA